MIEKGLKEDPYNPEILLIAARNMRMENEKHEDAKKLLERIIEMNPLYADAYFTLGDCPHHREIKTERNHTFRKIYQFLTIPAATYYNIGLIYGSRDDYDMAEKYFLSSIKSNQLYFKA